jgi:isoquinoline 1-oxidoreductase alpha subunit
LAAYERVSFKGQGVYTYSPLAQSGHLFRHSTMELAFPFPYALPEEVLMITLSINGKPVDVDAESDTPLLWVLRDHLNLTGTKFGCGIGVCGACVVHLNGAQVRACIMPVSACVDQKITTIEGLADKGQYHRVQQAWVEHQVPQCGYCQSGMIMATVALLRTTPQPSAAEIASAVSNICRCGTYPRVRKAIRALAASSSETEFRKQS